MKTKRCAQCRRKTRKFTGQKHRNGKVYSRGRCRECHNAYMREYRASHPGLRAWMKAYSRKYKKSEAGINARLKADHGITLAEFDLLLKKQGGGCAICGSTISWKGRRRLSVDHDHATGLLRGILCSACNTALGYMKDSPVRLRNAARYLERFAASLLKRA